MEAAADSDRSAGVVGKLLAVAAIAILLGYVPSLSAPFVAPKLAVLELAGALGLLGWSIGSRRPRWDRAVTGSAAVFGLLLVISAALAIHRGGPGAPYAGTEMMRFGALAGVAIGAGFAARADSANGRRLAEAIHASAGLVALLGLCQHLRLLPLRIPTISVPGSTFGNRNVAAEAVAMAIPFGLGLFRSRASTATPPPPRSAQEMQSAVPATLGALFLLAEIAYLAVARARGAWLGGALGMAIFFALQPPRLTRGTIYGVLATALLAIVAAAIPGRWTAHDANDAKRFAPATRVVRDAVDPTSPVARTRLGLWRRTLAIYRAHPLAGVGLGNFPVAFPLYAEPNATADGVLSPVAVPRRAHNDLLERLAETGPVAVAALLALYVALAAAAIRRVRVARRDGRPDDAALDAAAAGSLAAFVGCGLTGFPFAMPATVFLFGVAAGMLAAGAPNPVPATAPRRRAFTPISVGARGLVLCFVVLVGWWSATRLQASYFVARADAAGVGDDSAADAARALSLLGRAERATPHDFQVALRTSAAALRAGRAADASAAAERALDIEPASANAWEALARARLAANDPQGAAQAADSALGILHDYPGALATRAQAAGRLGDAAAADGARSRLSALAVTDDDARRLLATLTPPAR